MEALLKLAFEYAPAVAAGAVISVFVMTAVLKALGYSGIGDKSALVDGNKVNAVSSGVLVMQSQLSDIEKRLRTMEQVEKRLAVVEQDLPNRPTKEDHHRLELSFTRLEGGVQQMAAKIEATAHGITRIEDYMYAAAAKRGSTGV